MGIIEFFWGIKKLDEGINKFYLGDICRSVIVFELKIFVIVCICLKVVVYILICLIISSFFNSYYLYKCFSKFSFDIINIYSSILSIIFGRIFCEMKNIVVVLLLFCIFCLKEF